MSTVRQLIRDGSTAPAGSTVRVCLLSLDKVRLYQIAGEATASPQAVATATPAATALAIPSETATATPSAGS
jgi:hypothetical protein